MTRRRSRCRRRGKPQGAALFACGLSLVLAAPAKADVTFEVDGDSPFTTGPTVQLASADFNGDAHPDVALVGDGNVRVFLGDGSGGFTLSDSEPLSTSEWVAVGQLNPNTDSNLDLVVTGFTGGVPSLRFLFGNGSGGFSFVSSSTVQLTGASSNPSIAVAQIDADSNPDVVALISDGDGDNSVYVATGNGSGSFFLAGPYPASTDFGTSITVGKLNSDASPDVALSALSGPSGAYMEAMLWNEMDGELSSAAGSPFSAGGNDGRVVVIADFNDDGDNDLAVSNEHANSVGVMIGNGTGAFAVAPGSPQLVGDNPWGLAASDVNFDGDPDLLVGNDDDNDLDVLVGDGTGDFTRAAAGPFSMGSVTNATSVVAGDFDGDQEPDAVVGTLNGPVLMTNTTLAPLTPILTGSSPASPANENAPRIIGTAFDGDTVDLFASADCTGTPAVDDALIADLASPGLLVSVPDDQATTFTARVSNSEGTSPCSEPFTFTEDSTGPAPPIVSGLNPDGPANDNGPEVFGTATEVPGTIRLYTNSSCLGPGIGSGPAADFSTTGITATLPNDSTTTIHARNEDALGNPSGCSPTGVTYIEDSTPPPPPVLTDTDPESPSNKNTIRVKGTAAAGSTVRIFANSDCSGGALAAGSAAQFASPGIAVTVGDESSTSFRATGTDASGIPSACSPAALTYVEDSTPPGTAIDRSSPDRAGRWRGRFGFSSNDTGARYQCRLDGGDFLSCSSPYMTPRLSRGRHVILIRAIDEAGNADPSPARRRFRIPAR